MATLTVSPPVANTLKLSGELPDRNEVSSKNAPESTRDIIVSFLTRCSLNYCPVTYDRDFDAACRAEAIRRGCAPSGKYSLAPCIAGGVVMATCGYGHLPNHTTKVLIALYTACGIYLDDVFQHDIDVVRYFNERFVKNVPQGDPVLDCFAGILHELPVYYNRTVSNIMVTSTLNAVTALLLEYETQGMTVKPGALGYPTFTRVMSGASEAYSLFMFPGDFQLPAFVQSLQQVMIFINNGNDILSFHKEDTDGETVNRVSLLAAMYGISKHAVLWHLTNAAVAAHNRTLETLSSHPEALAAYRAFAQGYVGFHTTKRYRLDELNL